MSNAGESDRKERFMGLVRKYQGEEIERVEAYLRDGCGFDGAELTTKQSSDVSTETVDRLFSVYREIVYDNHLGVERDHRSIEDRPTLFDLLERGPKAHVSMDVHQEDDPARNMYLPTKEDIKRAHMLGGAVEMSSEARDLLSSIMMMKEAIHMQRTSALAESDRHRRTIKNRDLVLEHEMDGFDTVCV